MPSEPLSLRFLEDFDPKSGGSQNVRERRFLCPLCGADKPRDAAHRSLSANTQSGAWVCHRCGERGKLAEWRDEKPLDGRTLRRAKLRRAFSLDELPPTQLASTRHVSPASQKSQRASSARPWRSALRGLVPLHGTAGEKYLQSRGISIEIAGAAGVRFSPSWFGRPAVVFPIRDDASTLVAAQGRYISSGNGPKARTSGDKKAGVFAAAQPFENMKRGAPIVIVEAPIDALSLAMCGFPALALCGKDGWPDWLPIKCAFHNVALAFDADEAGDIGAEKLARVLASLGAKTFRVRPEGAKDWNEMLQQGRDELADWLAAQLLMAP